MLALREHVRRPLSAEIVDIWVAAEDSAVNLKEMTTMITRTTAATVGILIGTSFTLLGHFGNSHEIQWVGLFLLVASFCRLLHIQIPTWLSNAEETPRLGKRKK
jgi:hypothetical protein